MPNAPDTTTDYLATLPDDRAEFVGEAIDCLFTQAVVIDCHRFA